MGENLDVSQGWARDGMGGLTLQSSVVDKVLVHRVDPYKEDILEGCGVKEDLGGVVACCSRGGLDQERIQEEADGSHMGYAVAYGSLDDQVGMVMVHGEMDGLDLPCKGAEVVDSENG